ncbi:helix-turn-helix domain-containing protein [Photobacterium sp. OFAV2-7]|uniref:winged helix-turn-helix transcriptional regulator n=1 Tax=Photobacterium sp. OFAV2-7 TaxID=2917748 RepID=UPI001EF64E81|nr:helix-turn-helix domain-containing protein [Photobacterium sp. OFAV2-7]MCG7585953.1 helix-turn-helix transcriptional regulator [Photobacterium sp. OFAV2-7]
MNSNSSFKRSGCPIVNSLDIFGDKWTLVVLRDLHCGKKTYSDLANSPEKIPTNRLAERLKRLEAEEIILKVAYQEHPKRYEYLLTQKGKDILPILQEMARWGNKYVEGSWIPPEWFMKG